MGVRTSRELGRTIRAGNGGNKTQAVVLYLINRLSRPPQGSGYHVFLNNLFVSTRFIKYTRSQGIGITGICHEKGRINKELLKLKNEDKKDIILWGETHSIPIPNSKVYYIGWKDQAFVLIMSSVLSGNEQIIRLRRRPKETSSKVKMSRVPFGNITIKEFSIPIIVDEYNYYIGAVNRFDHLTA